MNVTQTETPITNPDSRSILGFPQPRDSREEGVLLVDGKPHKVVAGRSGNIASVEVYEIGFKARGASIDEGTVESNRDFVRYLIREHLAK